MVSVAQRYACDLLLIGMAIGRHKEAAETIKSVFAEDMSTQSTRAMLAAVINRDREAFAATMKCKLGVDMQDGELAADAVVRAIHESNQSDFAMNVVMSTTRNLKFGMSVEMMREILIEALESIPSKEKQ